MSHAHWQLPLPGMGALLGPVCPVCRQSAPVLGQWSPFRQLYLCRDCLAQFASPVHLLTDDGHWSPDTTPEQRQQYHALLADIESRLPKRPYHANGHRHTLPAIQHEFPLCRRCGQAHLRWQIDTYAGYCQRCEDELAVEALFRLRAIFGDADDETIFDRLYRSQQALFERGVLPDYWYALVLQEHETVKLEL